ncbi:MAG: hypothetical protein HYZ63_03355 [Candidatus Andersenbacteria bacterium]|nr:hypothetical protein [Candidatus Andersenbacteria bacterium]
MLTHHVGYHIHVDAQRTSPEFEDFAIGKLGFWPQDFLHEGGEELSYEPARHLTYHPKDGEEFKLLFGQMRDFLNSHPDMVQGYIEGECIPFDLDIDAKPFDPSIKHPFRLTLKNLPPGKFREDEIHVSLLRDTSDPGLKAALRAMGLYVAYLPKPEGVAAIFTVQGRRKKISELLPALTFYLQRAGGGQRCSIKEERIADSWMSSDNLALPPIVDKIEWL